MALDADGFETPVELAELTGSEVYLHLRRGDLWFMARIPADTAYGTQAHIDFDMGKAHLVDQISGNDC